MATPGVTTLIRDRFYSVSRQDVPAGPRIVAIAKRNKNEFNPSTETTAYNAMNKVADLDVVQATTEKDVIDAFGVGSDLHKAFLELITAGAERIHLVPLPYDTQFDHTNGQLKSASAGFASYGEDIFNAAFAAAEAAIPDVIIPWGRGGNSSDWDATTGATPNAEDYLFHANNSNTTANNWAYKVASKVKDISENTNPCIAVMGIAPYVASSRETLTPAQVSSHMSSSLALLPDRNNALMKAVGSYVSIIATEVKPVGYATTTSGGTTDYGYSNGAASLAATMSRTPSYTGLTNKALYNVQALRYAPTRVQQVTLNAAAVNAVILNFNKIAVFGGAVTYSAANSDYLRLSTKRIVDEASQLVRQVCQKFIGEPSTIQVRNSMETAISSGLRGMQVKGALLESDFNVTYVPSDNMAIVDLVLTPAFELNSIQVQISINI
jgi:hypothetical protein